MVEGKKEVMMMVVIVNMPRKKRPVCVVGSFFLSTATSTITTI